MFSIRISGINDKYLILQNTVYKEETTHTGEIKKRWTSYKDSTIKNRQTENTNTNKYLSLGA